MKTNWTVLFALGLLLFFAGCAKPGTKYATPDPNAKAHNQDVSDTKSESDNVNTDVNNALSGVSAFGKNGSIETTGVCGAAVDTTHAHDAIRTIYLNFDGTTVCPNPNRIRSGQIKVELIVGAHWTDAGAVLRITHINYKVTFPTLANHYLTFNGIKYLTNATVGGINWLSFYLTGSLTATLKERSNLQVTFDNGQTETWQAARLSTWGITNYTTVYATVNGDTTINGQTVDSWGTTRFGTNFTTAMIQPWYSGTTCGWWAPTSGKYTSTTDNFSVSATFGVNSSGNQVSSGCAYGLKLDWTLSNNSSGEALIPYY